MPLCERGAEWCNKMFCAEAGGVIGRVLCSEEGGAAVQRGAGSLGGNDALRIPCVVLDAVEMDASNRELYVELVLKRIRDRLGVADDQDVVGHLGRINRPRRATVVDKKSILASAWTVALFSDIFVIAITSLGLPVIEQDSECVVHGRVGIVRKQDAPACLIEPAAVDSGHHAIVGIRLRGSVREVSEVIPIELVFTRQSRNLRWCLWCLHVRAGGAVQAVESQSLLASPRGLEYRMRDLRMCDVAVRSGKTASGPNDLAALKVVDFLWFEQVGLI